MAYHHNPKQIGAYRYGPDGKFDPKIPGKQQIMDTLMHKVTIPEDHRPHLTHNYAEVISGDELRLRIFNGAIKDKGSIQYQVIWHRSYPEQCYNATKVVLNYRAARKEYDVPAYVLITALETQNKTHPIQREI